MVDVTEVNDPNELRPTEPTVDPAEVERQIKEVADEYNLQLESLNDMQNLLKDAETKSFTLLQQLYKLFKSSLSLDSSELESEYNASLLSLEEQKSKVSVQQTYCFHLLQKLRTAQVNFLVGIVNGQQQQLTQLQKDLDEARGSVQPRANNLA